MSGAKRKVMRNQMKRDKKEMTKRLSSMTNMPEACLACSEPFDKTSKEHAKTWFVVHRKNQSAPNLYCPECWTKANEIIEDFKKKKMKELQEAETHDN
jgi:hypothetical protein